MQGTQVVYLGRSIAKEGFRAFVYGAKDSKKLVNSWDEFEAHMATGIWFASKDDVIEPKPVIEEEKIETPKKRSK
jgi:hypothetical protein